ncbi:bifunctional folylpolyglutamate synthase/dihydrofolate synthase, partial [candidate division KSB1 bacterium]|nr:bifunctional folylpolyglutamate synthase/dihydrofolate synthase [candidate division KSB1 bacterium]
IHIAGTNGKGSTSAITESILRTSGYKTGLYTSPHLIDVRERIKCNDIIISKNELIGYIEKYKPLIEKYKCTFFETMTAIAFAYFADQKIDVAVIEVGLGGRLDATNVVSPILTIITEIEHDHTKQLGRSRKKIALEKAGIIKHGAVCLTGSQHKIVLDTLAQVCRERKTELMPVARLIHVDNIIKSEKFTAFDLKVNGSIYPQLKLPLLGDHQIQNASLAIMAANLLSRDRFQIKTEDIYHGLFDVSWPGRLQILSNSPKVIVDVAHNPDGINKLTQTIQELFAGKDLSIILGICKTKNYQSMIKKLCSIAKRIIAVRPDTHRALEAKVLARTVEKYQVPVYPFNDVRSGFDFALNTISEDTLILGTGSHYTVGEIINYYKKT